MRTIQSELITNRVVADLDHHEELLMEDDVELNPIQRRMILRRISRRLANEDAQREEARARARLKGDLPRVDAGDTPD